VATLRAVTEGTKGGKEVVERAGWWANHTSVATRLAMAVLFVSITAIIVSVFVASIGAGSEGEDLLHTRLSTLGGEKVAELGFYLEEVVAEVEALGLSPAGIDGVQAFTEGYGELVALTIEDVNDELDTLADFYFDDFVPMLEEVRGESVDILELTSGLEPAGISLQSTYIAENPFELGEKPTARTAAPGPRSTRSTTRRCAAPPTSSSSTTSTSSNRRHSRSSTRSKRTSISPRASTAGASAAPPWPRSSRRWWPPTNPAPCSLRTSRRTSRHSMLRRRSSPRVSSKATSWWASWRSGCRTT